MLMGLFTTLFGRRARANRTRRASNFCIPTVEFDARKVTDEVQTDLRESIDALADIEVRHRDAVYYAALKSISAGRDLYVLTSALLGLDSETMTKRRAADIAFMLNNRATAIMERQRQESLGISQAMWLHSGAPCCENPKKPTPADVARDRAHRACNGKRYDVGIGLMIDGRPTWPGREPGCKCVSKSIVKGFQPQCSGRSDG